jgi:hypothetical protein
MYANAVVEHAQQNGSSIRLIPLNRCLPTPTLNVSQRCASDALENLNAVLNDNSIKTIVVATTYPSGGLQDQNGLVDVANISLRLEQALLELIDVLASNNRRVILVGPLLTPGFDLPSELARKLRFHLLTEPQALDDMAVPREQFEVRFGSLMLALQQRLGDDFLQPHLLLCDTNFCYFGDEEGSYFADSSHLGQYGVSKVEEIFRNF